MPVNSALSDRQLRDQSLVVPDLTQWSRARYGMAGLIGSSSPLENGPHWPEGLNCGSCISASNVAKELHMSHTDDVCEWRPVRVLADFFIRNAGPPRNSYYTMQIPLVECIHIPCQLSSVDHDLAP